MGKRHSSRQDVCILTETGDIVDMRLETDSEEGYVASPDTLEAWELDFNQQCVDEKSGRYCQVISDRNKKPLKIFKNRPTLSGSTTETIASRKEDEELAFLNAHREKNKMLLWVGIIAALLAVVISIVVLVQLNRPSGTVGQTFYLTPVLAAIPAVTRKLKKIEDAESLKSLNTVDTTGLIQCIVIVEKTGKRTYPRIANSLVPDDSLERTYRGKPCHLLGLDKDGKLWAVEPENFIVVNESPKDCFIALQCEKEVNAVYSLKEVIVEKIKIGLFIVLCCAELIILFLIITAATGGNV